jgi:hypothetical protein
MMNPSRRREKPLRTWRLALDAGDVVSLIGQHEFLRIDPLQPEIAQLAGG